jgi:NADPH2:quinone reductase
LPHDTYGRDAGLFIQERLPFILGTNIAGTVVKAAPDVNSFAIGDQVFGMGNPLFPTPDMSGLQQYALLSAESAGKTPPSLTLDDAVTFPVNACTSFAALFHPNGFGFTPPFSSKPHLWVPSQTILIIGGGSNVGKLAIQFAKLAGIQSIVTIASGANSAALQELGATHVVDRHLDPASITSEIRKIVGQDGVTHIYDCVSWDYSFPISLLSPSKHSTLLTLHPCDDAERIVKQKGLDCRVQFILGNSAFLQPLTKQFWESLPGWIERGSLAVAKYRVVEGLDLKLVEEGLDSYRDGNPVTPVVVHPNAGD